MTATLNTATGHHWQHSRNLSTVLAVPYVAGQFESICRLPPLNKLYGELEWALHESDLDRPLYWVLVSQSYHFFREKETKILMQCGIDLLAC